MEVIHNGHFFDLILEGIAAASQSIHIESYIWWKGEICIRIAEALAARGQAGVEVHRLVHLMRQAGCEVRLFNPFRISNVGRLNIRTHRKIAVFDEITVGFTDPDIARQLSRGLPQRSRAGQGSSSGGMAVATLDAQASSTPRCFSAAGSCDTKKQKVKAEGEGPRTSLLSAFCFPKVLNARCILVASPVP